MRTWRSLRLTPIRIGALCHDLYVWFIHVVFNTVMITVTNVRVITADIIAMAEKVSKLIISELVLCLGSAYCNNFLVNHTYGYDLKH
jgi:hypothetical protein